MRRTSRPTSSRPIALVSTLVVLAAWLAPGAARAVDCSDPSFLSRSQAQQVVINPQIQSNYLFNGCTIGAATCSGPPGPLPIEPQLSNPVDILLARPEERDINPALNNIFDADLVCEQMRRINPEGAQEVCRWALQFAPGPAASAWRSRSTAPLAVVR